jgi:hypothetical protein
MRSEQRVRFRNWRSIGIVSVIAGLGVLYGIATTSGQPAGADDLTGPVIVAVSVLALVWVWHRGTITVGPKGVIVPRLFRRQRLGWDDHPRAVAARRAKDVPRNVLAFDATGARFYASGFSSPPVPLGSGTSEMELLADEVNAAIDELARPSA